MWFKLLMLVYVCVSFPLKCPEPAQWARRANGHCADPSKYFCLKNDLIKGYSENCTRSDFQQPGRKAVLRGGIDAEICSLERYQPFPIKFFTNTSTNCIFFKSFCNEEGQVVYDSGNRNTDTTCRCDYRRGFDFLVKPNNPCFCKPSQEDCSCFLKTCSNTSHTISPDYQCIYITNVHLVTQCRPITDEEDIRRRISEILETTHMEHNVLCPVKWNHSIAMALLLMVICGGVVVTLVIFKIVTKRSLCRICCRVYFIDEPTDKILYEGESFTLNYHTSRRKWKVEIYKSGIVVGFRNNLLIKHVHFKDEGRYYAELYGVRSKYMMLKVLRKSLKKYK